MNFLYLYIIRHIKKDIIALDEEELEALIAVFNMRIVDENKSNPQMTLGLWTWWTIKLNSYSLSIFGSVY